MSVAKHASPPATPQAAKPSGTMAHLDFSERLSQKVLTSLRALNDSLSDVRLSVAKIDSIAHQRLTLSFPAPAGALGASPTRVPAPSFLSATREIIAKPGTTSSVQPTDANVASLLGRMLLAPQLRGSHLDEALLGQLVAAAGLDAEMQAQVRQHCAAATQAAELPHIRPGQHHISPHAVRAHTPPPAEFLQHAHPRAPGAAAAAASPSGGSTLLRHVSFSAAPAVLDGGDGALPGPHVSSPGSSSASAPRSILAHPPSPPHASSANPPRADRRTLLEHGAYDSDSSVEGAPAGHSRGRQQRSSARAGGDEGEAEERALREARAAGSSDPFDSDDSDEDSAGRAGRAAAPAAAAAAARAAASAEVRVGGAADSAILERGIGVASPPEAAKGSPKGSQRLATAGGGGAGVGWATVLPPAPSAEPRLAVPVPFTFTRYSEAAAPAAAADEGDGDDDEDEDGGGVSDDIPFRVSAEVPAAAFYAAEEEAAAEAKRIKAVAALALQAGIEGTAAAGAAPALAPAAVPLVTVFDDTPPPRVQDWRGGDAEWPAAAAVPAPGEQAAAATAAAAAAAGGTRATLPPRFESFALRVVYEAGRTGFEEAKDLAAPVGALIAGRFRVRDFLGSAAFSSALACTDTATGEDCCLKVIKNNKDFVDQSLDEIKLLRYINAQGDADAHNVLRLREYFYHKEHLFLVTELLKDNLYEFQKYLADAGEPSYFTLGRLQRIARQVLQALAFLASKGLIHCDLKPENVLIKSYSRCDVKVIDFGSSCFVTDHLSSYIQSRSYRAPEVILGLPYGPKIDVWSLGCIMAELMTARVLFVNDSIQTILVRMQSLLGPFPQAMLDAGRDAGKYFTVKGAVYERGEHGSVTVLQPKPTNLRVRLGCDDADLLDFLSALLALDPARRPTAAQALQHPWLRKEYPVEPYVLPTLS